MIKYVSESSQGCTHGGWTVLLLRKGGMPYDDIGYRNVCDCIMPVDCNGYRLIPEQVKRRFCDKQKTTPSALNK